MTPDTKEQGDGGGGIAVEHIRDMVMPPYPYQKPQNGFGALSAKTNQETETSPSTQSDK